MFFNHSCQQPKNKAVRTSLILLIINILMLLIPICYAAVTALDISAAFLTIGLMLLLYYTIGSIFAIIGLICSIHSLRHYPSHRRLATVLTVLHSLHTLTFLSAII